MVQGATPYYFTVRDWPAAAGTVFTARDEELANRVAVLGRTVADMLFGPAQEPIDAIVRIKDVPFRVIGVLEAKGKAIWGQDQDDVILIPFSTAERRVLGAQLVGAVDQIHATAVDAGALDEAAEQIATLLRQRHRIQPG